LVIVDADGGTYLFCGRLYSGDFFFVGWLAVVHVVEADGSAFRFFVERCCCGGLVAAIVDDWGCESGGWRGYIERGGRGGRGSVDQVNVQFGKSVWFESSKLLETLKMRRCEGRAKNKWVAVVPVLVDFRHVTRVEKTRRRQLQSRESILQAGGRVAPRRPPDVARQPAI